MSFGFFWPQKYADHRWIQRVRSPGRITIDVFEQMRARGEAEIGGASTLVPDFSVLDSHVFRSSNIHPRIRAFYEQTTAHEIVVRSLHWRPWARALGALYRGISRALGNLKVPLSIREPVSMSSHVQDITLRDGGTSRAWMRFFSRESAVFYAAAVRSHADDTGSYLSLAFPLPLAHLSVMLRAIERGDGLLLSSGGGGHSGTRLIVSGKHHFVALPGPPTSEELYFEFDAERDVILGRHVDRLFGIVAFEMHYEIRQLRRTGGVSVSS